MLEEGKVIDSAPAPKTTARRPACATVPQCSASGRGSYEDVGQQPPTTRKFKGGSGTTLGHLP
eukprot:COSAG06_NODE_266_length_18831_cov_301.960015_3_plen_63_part_00